MKKIFCLLLCLALMGTFLSFAGDGNQGHDKNTVIPSGKSKVSSTLPASERAALIAIYNSTNGDNWTL